MNTSNDFPVKEIRAIDGTDKGTSRKCMAKSKVILIKSKNEFLRFI